MFGSSHLSDKGLKPFFMLMVILDFIILVILSMNIYSIALKADLPGIIDEKSLICTTRKENPGFFIKTNTIQSQSPTNLSIGDKIVAVKGLKIYNTDELEFLLDKYKRSKTVKVEIERRIKSENNKIKRLKLSSNLIYYYSSFYLIVTIVVCLIFILPGIYVNYKKMEEGFAYIFHLMMLMAAVMIGCTWGNTGLYGNFLNWILKTSFDISIIMLGIFSFHFSFLFPKKKKEKLLFILLPVYIIGFLASAYLSYLNYSVIYASTFRGQTLAGSQSLSLSPSQSLAYLDSFRNYMLWHDYLANGLFTILSLISIINMADTYMRFQDVPERRKLKWIFLGLVSSPLSYILLWYIPKHIFKTMLVPEWVIIALPASAPITFFISIAAYRFMDIDIILKKSTVYAVVISILVIIYSIVGIIANNLLFSLSPYRSYIVSISGVIIAAILFQPILKTIELFVDKKFFKTSYNFRLAQDTFIEKVKNLHTLVDIAELYALTIKRLLPLEQIVFLKYLKSQEQLQVIYPYNDDTRIMGKSESDCQTESDLFGEESVSEKDNYNLQMLSNIVNSNRNVQIIASRDAIEEASKLNEKTILVESRKLKDIRSYKSGSHCQSESDLRDFVINTEGLLLAPSISLILIQYDKSEKPLIVLCLGKKKTGFRFSQEDIDLLTSLAFHSAQVYERIELSTELIRKEAEAERLKKLNELKSSFVSSVSHELKTPLTSIRLMAESLEMKMSVESRKSLVESQQFSDAMSQTLTGSQSLTNNNSEFAFNTIANYMINIQGECDRLSGLINNVLDYSKIEKGFSIYNYITTDLNKIVDDALDKMNYQLRLNEFDVTVSRSESALISCIDKEAVSRAIMNLLSNAIKYSNEKKVLRIKTYKSSVTKQELGKQVKLPAEIMNWHCISVADEGIGVEEEEQELIFVPYYRSKNKYTQSGPGTGIGLPIVKSIMKVHNGKVEMKSKIGIGSEFILYFPEQKNYVS